MSGRKNRAGENRQRNSDKSRQGRPTDNTSRKRWKEAKLRQDKLSTYKVTFMRVRVTTAAVEKQKYYTFCVCVCGLRYPSCAVLYFHLWPVCLYNTFPPYPKNGTIFVGGEGELMNINYAFISVFNQLDAQNLFHNKFYFMPLHVSSTCAHHQEVNIALHSLWYHHTYRWCVVQVRCLSIPQ